MVLDVMQMSNFRVIGFVPTDLRILFKFAFLDSLGGNSEVDDVDRSISWSTDLHKIRIWL